MMETGEVTALGGRGEGVLRDESGKVVFVPGALPGERILYVRTSKGARYDRGVLERVEQPSPHRRPTPCPLDVPGGCGGCQLLAVDPQHAADLKAQQLRELVENRGVRLGDAMEPVRLAGEGLGYRNRARFKVDRQGRPTMVARQTEGRRGGRRQVPVSHCPVLHPALNELLEVCTGKLKGVRSLELRVGATTGECLVTFECSEPPPIDPVTFPASVIWLDDKGRLLPLKGLPCVHEVIDGRRLRISANAFFQGNTEGAITISKLVKECAGDLSDAWVADLHAGVGLFALTSLLEARQVTAIEMDPDAVADLRENAEELPVNVRMMESEAWIKDVEAVSECPDVVVLDPPRTGVPKVMTEAISSLAPPRVVLVSCSSRVLADDLPPFLAAGYRLERLIPVDQFSGTYHLESVLSLVRG